MATKLEVSIELVWLTTIVVLTIGLLLWFILAFVPSVIEDLRRNKG